MTNSLQLFNLLFENKLSDARNSLKDEELELFDAVFGFTPTLPNKFINFVINKFIKTPEKHNYFPTQVYDILIDFETLQKDNRIKEKDINQYSTLGYLEDTVEKSNLEFSKTSQKEKIKKDAKKIYEDSKYLVVYPESEGAACFYGKSTKWCISATQSENYFKRYYEQGIRFAIIIDKDNVVADLYAKVAIAYRGNKSNVTNNDSPAITENLIEIYDSQDNLKIPADLYQKYPINILKSINTFIGKDIIPTSKEDEIQKISSWDENDIKQYVNSIDAALESQEIIDPKRFSNILEHGSLEQICMLLSNIYSTFASVDVDDYGRNYNNFDYIGQDNLFLYRESLLKKFDGTKQQATLIYNTVSNYGFVNQHTGEDEIGIHPELYSRIIRIVFEERSQENFEKRYELTDFGIDLFRRNRIQSIVDWAKYLSETMSFEEIKNKNLRFRITDKFPVTDAMPDNKFLLFLKDAKNKRIHEWPPSFWYIE